MIQLNMGFKMNRTVQFLYRNASLWFFFLCQDPNLVPSPVAWAGARPSSITRGSSDCFPWKINLCVIGLLSHNRCLSFLLLLAQFNFWVHFFHPLTRSFFRLTFELPAFVRFHAHLASAYRPVCPMRKNVFFLFLCIQ